MAALKKRMIICGCLSPSEKVLPKKILQNVPFLLPKNLYFLDKIFPGSLIKFRNIPDACDFDSEKKIDKQTGFIRISQGYAGDCSYCLEKEIVGPLRSKSIPQAEKELLLLLKKGYTTISLVSDVDDIGSYGSDIKSDFPKLLRRLASHLGGGAKLKLASMDPFWAIKYQNELFEIFKSDKISYAHIAIQSASNRLLKLMRRHYKIEKVEQILKQIREMFSNIYLATTVIIGFSSETNKDFQKTLNFLGKGYFDEVYLRRYYETSEVDSYKIRPKIPQFLIEKRYKLAVELLQAKKIKISKEN